MCIKKCERMHASKCTLLTSTNILCSYVFAAKIWQQQFHNSFILLWYFTVVQVTEGHCRPLLLTEELQPDTNGSGRTPWRFAPGCEGVTTMGLSRRYLLTSTNHPIAINMETTSWVCAKSSWYP